MQTVYVPKILDGTPALPAYADVHPIHTGKRTYSTVYVPKILDGTPALPAYADVHPIHMGKRTY